MHRDMFNMFKSSPTNSLLLDSKGLKNHDVIIRNQR